MTASTPTMTRTNKRIVDKPQTSLSSFSTSLKVSVTVLLPLITLKMRITSSGSSSSSSSSFSSISFDNLNVALTLNAESRFLSEAVAVMNIQDGYFMRTSLPSSRTFSVLSTLEVNPSIPEATYIRAPSAIETPSKTIMSFSTASVGHSTSQAHI